MWCLAAAATRSTQRYANYAATTTTATTPTHRIALCNRPFHRTTPPHTHTHARPRPHLRVSCPCTLQLKDDASGQYNRAIKPLFQAGEHGFVAAVLDEHSLQLFFYSTNGDVLYRTAIKPRATLA